MGGNFETDQTGHQQRAGQQSGRGEHDGGSIQIAGAGHRQEAAGQQAQQRELEESVHLVRDGLTAGGTAVIASAPPADP